MFHNASTRGITLSCAATHDVHNNNVFASVLVCSGVAMGADGHRLKQQKKGGSGIHMQKPSSKMHDC
eukprot:scaffold49599_cov18-Tisochrysis_lutea.AAC.2